MELFPVEGGIYAREQRTYVYRKCGYIKVDVTFEPVGEEAEEWEEGQAEDTIITLSRPYLQWSISD